jgi:ABC-type sugar transport system substrate-binding protein
MDSQIQAAADAAGIEVVFQDAAQDNADQVSDVENLLTQGIDLLIISPNEAAPLNDAVKAAWDACVPVIVLDRNLAHAASAKPHLPQRGEVDPLQLRSSEADRVGGE